MTYIILPLQRQIQNIADTGLKQKKSRNSWILTDVKFAVLYLCFYVIFCRSISLRTANVTNNILIIFYKENINIKGNLYIQKGQCTLDFILDVFVCPEFIFCTKSLLHFVWNASLVCCSKWNFQLIIYWILDSKDEMRQRQQQQLHFFFPPRKKNMNIMTIRASFLFFSTFFLLKNQSMMAEYKVNSLSLRDLRKHI